jgi:hypothetical protein
LWHRVCRRGSGPLVPLNLTRALIGPLERFTPTSSPLAVFVIVLTSVVPFLRSEFTFRLDPYGVTIDKGEDSKQNEL